MLPETIEELVLAWRSDLSNFDTENPANTAGVLLARLADNAHTDEWCTQYQQLDKITDLLIEIEGIPGNYDEIDYQQFEHHRLFEEVEELMSELEEKISL